MREQVHRPTLPAPIQSRGVTGRVSRPITRLWRDVRATSAPRPVHHEPDQGHVGATPIAADRAPADIRPGLSACLASSTTLWRAHQIRAALRLSALSSGTSKISGEQPRTRAGHRRSTLCNNLPVLPPFIVATSISRLSRASRRRSPYGCPARYEQDGARYGSLPCPA